jgi:hypothetical protein
LSLSRKKRIQEELEKGRRNRRIVTVAVAAVLISMILVAVYLAIRPGAPGRFPFDCLGVEGQLFTYTHGYKYKSTIKA